MIAKYFAACYTYKCEDIHREHGSSFDDVLALAPEVESQDARFNDFLALAPEVEKTILRRLDFIIVKPWLKKSTKPVPGMLI